MHEELKDILHNANANPASLRRIFDLLPNDLHTLSKATIDLLVDFVPQLADLLRGEIDETTWRLHADICELLAFLGPRAQQAIPALLEHVEKVPRMEYNALAIGKIGGPGTTRHLIRWTHWQGSGHDRKRTDAVCSAIRMLGDSAIEELLELAVSAAIEPHDRASALLNLLENTAYPRERLIPMFAQEMDRNPSVQCFEALAFGMEMLGGEYPQAVLAAIEPLLRGEYSKYSIKAEHYIKILERIGPTAVGLLREIIDQGIHRDAAAKALANIEGEKHTS